MMMKLAPTLATTSYIFLFDEHSTVKRKEKLQRSISCGIIIIIMLSNAIPRLIVHYRRPYLIKLETYREEEWGAEHRKYTMSPYSYYYYS